jgi:DNA sulfur modification protein DndC
MANNSYRDIIGSLAQLYVADDRPWLVGFSGGKDSTMLASLIFNSVLTVPAAQRKKLVSVLCTDTRVEIPAIAEIVEGALSRMRKFSQQSGLNIEVNLLKPPPEQSFWVNIIGRGYPPPNRTFRWCTQRLKIDPVTVFVNQRLGHWSEAILHLGARRSESSTRSQTMAGREARNGLLRHPDLPRVWVSNPIEFLLSEMEEEVAQELSIRADTLRRMLAKVEEYSESHRAHGLPDDLLDILKDDLYIIAAQEDSPAIH